MTVNLLYELITREALAHAGFLLIALAFIVRDPLVLHSRAVLAYSFFVGFASLAQGGPAWHLIGWYALFMAINGAQVARLFRDRYLDRMTDEEQRLAGLAFAALDKCAVKRFLRLGRWTTFEDGAGLVVERRAQDALYLIAEGRALISVGGRPLCELGPGRFIGELSYVSGDVATATAVASGRVRVLAWPHGMLRGTCARQLGIRGVLHAAVGADLARKLADHTLTIGGVTIGGASGLGVASFDNPRESDGSKLAA